MKTSKVLMNINTSEKTRRKKKGRKKFDEGSFQ